MILLLIQQATAFTHFEGRHCHPIDHTPSGALMLAVNALEGRLSVFAAASSHTPVLLAEIPVGVEPISVRARTDREAWIVNEVSDSVSIVDLTLGSVIATLAVPDEPADVIFANGKAFVSCARNNRIAVFDVHTHTLLDSIPLMGLFPRSLAVSPDESKLYVALFFSGNRTTTLPFRQAPAVTNPSNPQLPAAPQTALIVADSDPRIPYSVIDHDIAEIDTATLTVTRYYGDIGTNILSVDCDPLGQLWVGSTEAKNLIQFEPNLRGIFSESRIARLQSGAITRNNLNPHADQPVINESEKQQSLAQPMALSADATGVWLVAFASDRLARMDASGTITRRIDLRVNQPMLVRGPRGISRHPVSGQLAIFNKLSNTISLVDPSTFAIVSEVAVASHCPLPNEQREGRGIFYDARRSGNGTVACGSCHMDADLDGVAWDLGDPSGELLIVSGSSPSIGEPDAVDRLMHPMKGPMMTQTLRGIANTGPFHWRGDKKTIQDFNSTFAQLQAGQEISATEMDHVAAYLESLRNHPNPYRMADNSLPLSVAGGNPRQGEIRFHQLAVCSKCHEGPRGTNHVIDEFSSVLTRQPIKNAGLEHVYKKVYYTPQNTESMSGYGFTHDGTGHDYPRGHEYDQDRFHLYTHAEEDVMAYILCTETGTAPAVGSSNNFSPQQLETQAINHHCDLIVHAVIADERRTFFYESQTGMYLADTNQEAPWTAAMLIEKTQSITFIAVAPGNGIQLSIDRDGDGIRNRDLPPPLLSLNQERLPTIQFPRADWFCESSHDLKIWQLFSPNTAQTKQQFFRLHRTW